MKKYSSLKSTMSAGIVFFAVMVALLTGCQKAADPYNPGGNPGGGPGPGASEVFIQGHAFSPSNLTVTVNTTVTWTNKDAVSHTVTSDNGAFVGSGLLGTNGTFSFKFTAAGVYPYHCTPHPDMTATITVN